MSFRPFNILVVLGVSMILAACESTSDVKEEAPVSTSTGTAAASSGTTTGATTGGGFTGSPLDDPNSLLSNRVVYFDYDQSVILQPDRPIIEAHGRYLADNPGATITLEGHADERGSREYNIALGEARANAVRQLMALLGASGSQVRTVSYGEERPAVEGHDESAWSQNRRVEIIYRNQ